MQNPDITLPKTPNVKEYIAIINQTGTSDPVATVLNSNNINYLGDITWTRNDTGDYTGTNTGVFIANKTYLNTNTDGVNGQYYTHIGRINENSIQLYNLNFAGANIDDCIAYINIKVFNI